MSAFTVHEEKFGKPCTSSSTENKIYVYSYLRSNGFVIAFSDVSINSHKRYSMNIGEMKMLCTL